MNRINVSLILIAIFCLNSYSQKKLIAFSSDATSNDKQQIFIMDENGDSLQQITYMEIDCYFPKFSPDGKKIIFQGKTDLSDMLYMVNLEDSSRSFFPPFIDGGSDASFSPDGRLLIYRSEKDDNNAIYIMELDSGQSFSLSDGSLSMYPEFSPDGNKVVYSTSMDDNFDLAILDLTDTTENAQRTIVSSKDAELYGTFSPDGNKIAFSSFDINYKGTLKICDSDGKNVTVVTSGGSAYNPKFSPDGKYLGFVWNRGSNLDLYVCNSDGGDIRQITSGTENTVQFDWSGDGKKIVYESVGEGVSSITVYEVETGSSQNLTGSNANNLNPSFQK